MNEKNIQPKKSINGMTMLLDLKRCVLISRDKKSENLRTIHSQIFNI